MSKLTPKENQAMDDIIHGANPLLFNHLGRFLGISAPITKEEKEAFLMHLLVIWKDRFK